MNEADDEECNKANNRANSTWAHDAERYEWDKADGDVGPRNEKLEKELFQGQHINLIIESEVRVGPVSGFTDAGLHPVILDNVQLCGYQYATPIQAYAFPAVIRGHDMIGIAQTGSGKTAAFLIPCISELMGKVRELAAPRPGLYPELDGKRIFDEARRLCYRSMLRPCVAYGGAPVRNQINQLAKGCDLFVATPGRLLDTMSRPDILSLSRVKFTIIIEADEMLHGDWDINEDGDHRYLLFSATFPKRVRKLAAMYLASDHVHVGVGRTGLAHANVKQHKQETADFIDDYLFNMGLPSTSIHADRTQWEREDALCSFKSGKSLIMVATGVSGRGLDVRNVMHIINFDFPSAEFGGRSEYVHRIAWRFRISRSTLKSEDGALNFDDEDELEMGNSDEADQVGGDTW
ncbi:uncharacterized protein Z518_07914 [Rhinocladiella mackenziei CBS 650.93]|uniref:RNA helicase n=1 Tax=Rhinocladiella mackenziei CBS 650.93 TaxID=1442369 RepID=A0A0D2IZC4_9EURO|nr:uncharacterized protein Z518_07914 [Rhinocladiella mackenziei CBS 650.93]KIX01975.1 hypothetical protein Z518_07914 [Rhinocladiella mackenziei CBS 650.93]